MDINKKSRSDLKAVFIKNAVPTQRNFQDLIDATLNHHDDGVTKSADGPLCIEAQPTDERPIVHLYEDFSAATPNFVLSLLPGVANGTTTVGNGLGIGTGAGAVNASLFIEEATGDIGIGTVDPQGQKLAVAGSLSASGLITANAGLSVPAGQTFTASGAVALTSGATVSGGVLNANAGLTIPTGQTLNTNGTVALNAGATVSGGVLNANAGLAIPTGQTLTASGSVALNSGATVSGGVLSANAGLAIPTGQTLTADGSVVLNSGATVSGAVLNANAGLNVPSGQTLTANGSVLLNAGATVLGGVFNANAGLAVPAGQTLTTNGSVALNAGATVSGSVLNANAGLAVPAGQTLTANGSVALNAGATVSGSVLIANAGLTVATGQTLTANGSVALTSGATVSGSVLNANAGLTVATGQTLTANGSVALTSGATVSGNVLNANAGLAVASGQTLTANGSVSLKSGATVSGSALLAQAGATVTGGALTVGASGATQNLTVYGSIAASAGATVTGGSLTVGASGATQNLTVNGSITASAGATVTGGALVVGASGATQNLTVNGSITASAGATVTGGSLTVGASGAAQNLTVYGPIAANAGATITGGALTVGSSTTAQSLTVYGPISASAGATITGGALTIGSSTTAQSLTVYGAISASAGATITGGALTVGSSTTAQSLTVYGAISANAGATIAGGALNVGSSTTGQNLNVYGTTNLNSALNVSGATTFGTAVKITGDELLIDKTSSRGTRTSGSYRRALLHGATDTLYVNFNGDYTNGVKVSGQLTLDGPTWAQSNNIYLRGAGDHNHGVGWFGNTRPFSGVNVDGPGVYGYTGGVLGTIRTVATGVEGSLVLTGGASSGGYAQITSGLTDDFSGGLTVEAWVYFSSLSYSYARIIDFGNASGTDNVLFCQVGTTSSLRLDVYNGTSHFYCDAASVLTTGAWMHLAATVDTSGNVTIYKNGVAQTGVTTNAVQLPSSTTRANCYIGRSNWSQDGYLAGKLAHVKVWTRALSADEISDIHTAVRVVSTTNLAAWWPLDDCTGTSARDLSGNSRTGTLSASGAAYETYQGAALSWDASNNVTVGNKLQSGNVKSTVVKTDQQQLSTISTWTDLDSMSLTVTTGAGTNLLILFTGGAVQNTAAANSTGYFRILIDGTAVAQSVDQFTSSGYQLRTVSLQYLKTGLTSGSHTIKVQWMTSAATLTCCWTALGGNRTLTVVEL